MSFVKSLTRGGKGAQLKFIKKVENGTQALLLFVSRGSEQVGLFGEIESDEFQVGKQYKMKNLSLNYPKGLDTDDMYYFKKQKITKITLSAMEIEINKDGIFDEIEELFCNYREDQPGTSEGSNVQAVKRKASSAVDLYEFCTENLSGSSSLKVVVLGIMLSRPPSSTSTTGGVFVRITFTDTQGRVFMNALVWADSFTSANDLVSSEIFKRGSELLIPIDAIRPKSCAQTKPPGLPLSSKQLFYRNLASALVELKTGNTTPDEGTIRLSSTLDLRDSDIDGIEKRDLVDEPSIRSLLTCKNVHEEENSLHSMPCGTLLITIEEKLTVFEYKGFFRIHQQETDFREATFKIGPDVLSVHIPDIEINIGDTYIVLLRQADKPKVSRGGTVILEVDWIENGE